MLDTFSHIFSTLRADYEVKDVITDQTTFLFILESPHVQELKYKVPVAGSSGASISKHLFGEEYVKPLGRLVKYNLDYERNHPSLNKIGLMNVCNIPMQKIAYQNATLKAEYETFFDALEGIRSNNQTIHYRQASWNVMQQLVLNHFRERLEPLKSKTIVIVPCGRFAQKFFHLTECKSATWTVIENVPHPSYNSWSRPKYEEVIKKVKNTFRHC
ncbi:hypothetical protein [Massilibacterium senegalense]|uniref:hypothetical protein n=1 Tax=Massilibacterium senegalense TaxID=1632858 RepID=UPI0007865BFD|nr:hypothetical protein [Massilibacterium senegalense]